jgi:hypothetical protein
VGWKQVVPKAKSLASALDALWNSLDTQHAFATVEAWDSSFVDDKEGEVVVWELQCIGGRYQNIDYTFNTILSTMLAVLARLHSHMCIQACRRKRKVRKTKASPAAVPAPAAAPTTKTATKNPIPTKAARTS